MTNCLDEDERGLTYLHAVTRQQKFDKVMVYIYYITVILSLLYIFGYRYKDYKPGFVKAIFTVLILIMFVELAIQ